MKKQFLKILMLLMFGMVTTAMMGQQEVKGVVTSDAGELLPGVSVILKGTTTGVTSDFDGNYSIAVPNSSSVLVFSYLGMKTREITVGNQTTLNVVLETDSQQLDEVVVTALGISREKKSLGYSVSRSEEHTSELQSRENLVCRLLLEKK